MKDVVIYSLVHCPYCVRAKDLLKRNSIPFREIIADDLPRSEVDELFQKSRMRTFPQIFVDGAILGGFSDLQKIDESVGVVKYLLV